MQKLLFILFPAVFFLSTQYAYSQKCNCPGLKVLIYDFDNSAAKPDWYKGGNVSTSDHSQQEINEFVDWQAAPQLGSGAFLTTALQNNKEIHFLTASFHKERGASFSAGTADAFASPAGEIKDVDYIVTGNFIKADGHFLLRVHLEDAKTRDHFGEETVPLPSLKTAPEAGSEIAGKLSPLLETIRKYQHLIRDEKRPDETAISAKYELTAAKTTLRAGATTELKLKMYDCDDQSPLKDRDVMLKTLNSKSTISPSTVKTDDNGEARATFKAGDQPENVKVFAEYQYTSVTHHSSYATLCGDDLLINVEGGYTLKVEFEASGHGDNGARYHALAQGEIAVSAREENNCYILEPANEGEMEFHVKEVIFQSDQGKASYQGPQTFSVPIKLSVNNCDKSPTFKIAFSSFGDAAETYSTSEGGSFQAPMLYSLAMATLGSSNLKKMQSQAQDLKNKAEQFKGKEASVDAAAKRLQKHQNDPGYLQTQQGKNDLALMQQMAKSMGYNPNNVRPDAARMKNLDNLHRANEAQKKRDEKMTRPGYVGSEEYYRDQADIQKLKGNVNMNAITGSIGIDMNILTIEAPFKNGSKQVVDKIQKDKVGEIAGSKGGWEYGQFHVTIENAPAK